MGRKSNTAEQQVEQTQDAEYHEVMQATDREPDIAHMLDEVQEPDYGAMTPEQIFNLLGGGEMSRGGVSRTMKALAAEGYTTAQIAKLLNKRYQHVRNVLKEPAKKA
ncbi:MAG: hypothetical protein AB7L09_21565 [Nitrospira sp.]